MEKIAKNQLFIISPLVLAYIGDSVHTLYVREYVISQNIQKLNDYNKQCSYFCKAQTQSKVLDRLAEVLQEEEKEIVRRARNSKSNHKAKNSSVAEYNKATSFEALIGYLYLSNQTERLNYILQLSVN